MHITPPPTHTYLPPHTPSPAGALQRRTLHTLPCSPSLRLSLRLRFSSHPPSSPSLYHSWACGWVNFFFSNFLLLFPLDLTFHAPGQITHRPLPLGLLLRFFFRGGTCRRPWEGEAGWGRDLEQHLARQGFSCLSCELRAVNFRPTHTEPIAPPFPCFPKKPVVGVGTATPLAQVNYAPSNSQAEVKPSKSRGVNWHSV